LILLSVTLPTMVVGRCERETIGERGTRFELRFYDIARGSVS